MLNKLSVHSFLIEGYYSNIFMPYDMPYHGHNSFEIMFVEKGSCKILTLLENKNEVNEIELLENQFVFLNAGTLHRLIVDNEGTKILNLEIKAVLQKAIINYNSIISLSSSFANLAEKNLPFYKITDNGAVKKIILSIINEESLNCMDLGEKNTVINLLVANLFIEMARCVQTVKSDSGISYIKLAKNYISNNYHNPIISVCNIADYSKVSQSYLQRLFKLQYNCSVLQYLNKYRLMQAAYMMYNSNHNITEIYTKTGFNTRQSFNKQFLKKFLLTPSQFKKQNLEVRFRNTTSDSEMIGVDLIHPNYI